MLCARTGKTAIATEMLPWCLYCISRALSASDCANSADHACSGIQKMPKSITFACMQNAAILLFRCVFFCSISDLCMQVTVAAGNSMQ